MGTAPNNIAAGPAKKVRDAFYSIRASGIRRRLVGSLTGTFGLTVAQQLFAFIVSVLLSRTLGASGYGTYAYALSWLSILTIPATLGLDSLLVREVAKLQMLSRWEQLHGLIRWSNAVAFCIAAVIAVLAIVTTWTFSAHAPRDLLLTLSIVLALLPIAVLTRLRLGTLRGLRHIIAGQLPEKLLHPVLLIALVSAGYLILQERLTAVWAMGAYAIAATAAFALGAYLLHRRLPSPMLGAVPAYEVKPWLTSTLPLLLIGGMQVINTQTDILMLGTIKGTAEVGVYRVASRGAQLIALILTAFNVVLAPTIARLYAGGEIESLQRLITRSARVILMLSLPLALLLIAFGEYFLAIFGREFIGGHSALTILALGQLMNVATGTVGLLLNMTGHERDTLKGVFIGAGLNVAFNAALIPLFSAEGAAVATSASLTIWNIILVVWAHKKVGIHTTALGIRTSGRN